MFLLIDDSVFSHHDYYHEMQYFLFSVLYLKAHQFTKTNVFLWIRNSQGIVTVTKHLNWAVLDLIGLILSAYP